MDKTNALSRRTIIKGLGAGIATLALSPVLGETKLPGNEASPPGLEDPLKKYPKPPFKPQSQPWRAKWSPVPIMAKAPTRVPAV